MESNETIFSKIIRREIPADIVHETDEVLAFRDINPQAPIHVLVIPKKGIVNMIHAQDADAELLGQVLLTARDVAAKLGLDKNGYRLVINNGDDSGQEVPHIHVHLLAGRKLQWPPG